MGIVDAIIIAVVAGAVVLCIRNLAKSRARGACAGCGESGSCSVARTGQGSCPASEDMVEHMKATMDRDQGSGVGPQR